MHFRKLIDRYAVSAAAYAIVAGISAIIEWSTFFVAIEALNPFRAAICAFVVATVVNYFLSRGIAFNSKRAVRDEFILVFMFSALAFFFNFLVFASLYAIVGLDPMIAKVGGTCVGLVLNYGFRQFVVFSPASRFATFSSLLNRTVDSDPGTQSDMASYPGHRILEAMRSAPRYANEIYLQLRSATPSVVGPTLDFGAGDGLFAEKFLSDGAAVECVEPDVVNQGILRRLGLKVAGSIGELANNRYCLAYSINVLEHVQELDLYLAELNRVLRPGGILFVFVPALEILWTSLDTEVGHVRRFTRPMLGSALARAGFEVVSLRYFDSLGFFAALAVRLLEKFGMFEYSASNVGFYDRAIFPISRIGDRVLRSVLGKNLLAVARKSNSSTLAVATPYSTAPSLHGSMGQ